MALAHAIKSKTAKAYRRGDLLDKRQQLMTAWQAVLRLRAVRRARLLISEAIRLKRRTHGDLGLSEMIQSALLGLCVELLLKAAQTAKRADIVDTWHQVVARLPRAR